MDWLTWNNQFALTVPVTESKLKVRDSGQKLTSQIRQALKKDYGISLLNDIPQLLVEEEHIKDFGVYRAMVTLDDKQLFGFALWIVRTPKRG